MSLDLKELAEELDELREREDDADNPLDEEDKERLQALSDFEGEIGDLHLAHKNIGSVIAESDWKDYCEDTAYDIGMCERGSMLANYVDWERWAENCKSDYSSADFEAETYYWRG